MTFRIENLGVTLLPERRAGGSPKKRGEFVEHTSCSDPSEEGCLCCEHSLAQDSRSAGVKEKDLQVLHAQIDELLASISA